MYQPKEYWEKRLWHQFSLAGTGHSGFSKQYNCYMYKLKKRVLNKIICRYSINVKNSRVLDIGCGTGFFVDYYIQKKAHTIVGIDITNISINSLQKKFKSHRFYKVDIGKECLPVDERFDIINIFDVLYHITNDDEFYRAIENIDKCCCQGTWVLITDALIPEIGTANHVRYRRLEDYKKALTPNGIDVIAAVPIFHFMGKTPVRQIKSNLAKRVLARVIDSAAPILYLLDAIYCPLESSNMNLLVCQKI